MLSSIFVYLSTNYIYFQPSPAPSSPQPPPPQTSSGTGSSGGSTSGQRTSLAPPPPLGRVVGGRMRSGSAPSPIKIARDSRDLNAYKIISPLPENALETPSTADSDAIEMRQTFPETPNAFSPFWSPGSASPGMVQRLPEGYDVSPMPQTPMSAALPTRGGHQASLDQQILLTRAATVARARHSRQGSLPRNGPGARSLPKPQAPASTPVSADATNQDEDKTTDDDHGEGSAQVVQAPPSKPSETSPVSSASQYSETSEDPHPLYEETDTSPGFAVVEATIAAHPTSPSSLASSPRLGYLTRDDASHSTYSSPSVTTIPRSHSPSSNQLGSVPQFSDPFDGHTNSSPHLNQRTPAISPHSHYVQTPPPVVVTPPAGDPTSAPSPYLGHSLRRISEISHTFESPPPYDTIDHDQPPSITPSPSNSNGEPPFITGSAQPSPPVTHDSSSEHLPLSRKTSNGNRDRRGRMRPTGPRRPLSHCQPQRIRNASVSSINSQTPNAATTPTRNPSGTPVIEHKTLNINPPAPNDQLEPGPSSNGTTTAVNNTPVAPSPKSPNFHVPPMPYRGLTMDQAKWTFTSAQLQSVVSRAIRQSAEASSIRLLRLETLDNEIPQELKRLEARKAEIKAKYRSLTRASESLFSKLSGQIANGSANSQRTVEELREVTKQLNKLTEQLHSVDQQHAQIQNLVEVHSASALSMALRKLNASFLKQLTQTQELQRQVADLEDEIWTINELRSTKLSPENQLLQSQSPPQPQSNLPNQASSSQQGVPRPFPTEPPASSSPELEKKRSAQSAVITRKPSLRYSRSIRWSGNRLSQRSSLSSNGGRMSMMFGGLTSGTGSTFGVPPVPPLPRRRPTDINTEPPTRSATVR